MYTQALAVEFEFYVISDDVYHFLDWSAAAATRCVEIKLGGTFV